MARKSTPGAGNEVRVNAMYLRVCWVVVLGDFGRSPRMQYHASSLLKKGARVHVLAYEDSSVIPFLAGHPNLTCHPIAHPPQWLKNLPRMMTLLLKAFLQLLHLLVAMLWMMPMPDLALVQLPPSIPTLMVCWLVKTLRGVVFIFDWHNFAFTLMGLTDGEDRLLVKVAKWLEMTFGRCGNGHMCVTKAMKEDLKKNWGIDAVVVYDRPPDFFKPANNKDLHDLMGKLKPLLAEGMHVGDFCADLSSKVVGANGNKGKSRKNTSISTISDDSGRILLNPARPGIVVSSTSWTPDEDFSLLLEAACEYDAQVENLKDPEKALYPKLLFIVTGKGPMKEYYIEKMKSLEAKHFAFRTAWLEPEDYPKLLGCADLGVSLHSSSSNLDLPMKIVDMFGCALPVCALGYSCLDELVEHEKTGLIFSSSQQLGAMLFDLFKEFPHGNNWERKLGLFKRNLSQKTDFTWDENWDKCALPVLQAHLKELNPRQSINVIKDLGKKGL